MADDVGATYGPEPMAALVVSNDSLQLTSPRGNFTLPRSQVSKIGRGKMYPWFFASIRIHHQCPGIPSELQFKPLGMKTAELLGQLRNLGLPIA